jgi:Arc/MetJ-type ribon-helix-helix transcriptional regulator
MLELKPETEQLVQEEIRRGHFHSVDELIVQGMHAWREKHQISPSAETPAERHRPEGKKSLAQLFAESPFKGLSMNFERFPDILPPG